MRQFGYLARKIQRADYRTVTKKGPHGCSLGYSAIRNHKRGQQLETIINMVEGHDRSESYGRSPIEILPELGKRCSQAGVVSILTPNGYRYYLTNFQPGLRTHQLLATYMAMFYFGSVARYRPSDYEKMLTRKFGWAIEEFLSGQGHQFVYMIANALLKQEVVAPWALRSKEVDLI